jgi:hypothetical protein
MDRSEWQHATNERPQPIGIVMKRIAVVAVACLVAAYAALRPVNVTAQTQIPLNPRVHIQYAMPKHAVFMPLRQRLMNRGFLEEYSQFLSPLHLKQDLTVSLEECGFVNSDYQPAKHYIQICYEYLAMVENEAAVPSNQLPPAYMLAGAGLLPGFGRAEVIVGGLIFVLLHETGHAVFDIQGVPRLGHEEDAADEIAGFMMLQFGKGAARAMVKGAINVDHELQVTHKFNQSLMADVHSLDIQRYENILCLAYGSPDGDAFKDLADAFLPAARKPNCRLEYQQAARAFNMTIMPYVDKSLMEKVRRMPLFAASDTRL